MLALDTLKAAESLLRDIDPVCSLTVAPDIAQYIRNTAEQPPNAPPALFGLPIEESSMLQAGTWIENYRDRDVVHFRDGRILTIERPAFRLPVGKFQPLQV